MCYWEDKADMYIDSQIEIQKQFSRIAKYNKNEIILKEGNKNGKR
tara:strand:- start:4182 stop:4316 length:135 start_codon:yes stop_codon:yes gene_type:complete